MERSFQRDIGSLDKVFEFIQEFIGESDIDQSLTFTINFVIEEIFTNMVKYNPGGDKDILINLKKEGADIIICLTDFNASEFDITKVEKPDLDKPLNERKIGGLGLYLVNEMVDEIDYEFENQTYKIIMIKHLEK
jgi:serine/threonine-protein kinase RsbW